MATRTTTTLVDDLDGSTADETVSFGLDRIDYEIDLSADHAGSLRDALDRFVSAARRSGGRRNGQGARPRATASATASSGPARSRSDNAQIREWATAQGVTLAERGRIPSQVVEAYEAGDASRLPHSNGSAPAPAPKASTGSNGSSAPASEPASAEGETRGRDTLTAPEREAVRAWAVEQGIEVKARGQLKKDLVANYRAWQSRQ